MLGNYLFHNRASLCGRVLTMGWYCHLEATSSNHKPTNSTARKSFHWTRRAKEIWGAQKTHVEENKRQMNDMVWTWKGMTTDRPSINSPVPMGHEKTEDSNPSVVTLAVNFYVV